MGPRGRLGEGDGAFHAEVARDGNWRVVFGDDPIGVEFGHDVEGHAVNIALKRRAPSRKRSADWSEGIRGLVRSADARIRTSLVTGSDNGNLRENQIVGGGA